jgi:hypothetical protein
MCFTVADVEKIERFKDLLQSSEPTYYECMPPSEQLPPSPIDAFYTLYSVHEFDDFLDALEKREERIARYVLTATGELCFGHEGEPGKSIPEYWQMLGEDTMVIAAGNLFVTNGKITGLSDQSPCATGRLSLIYTLRALYKNDLPLALDLELIQSTPDHNGEYSSFMTKVDLQYIISHHANFEHDADDELLDEEYSMQKQHNLYARPSTPHPFGRFGLFYNKTDENININRAQSPTHELADVPETTTTPEVVRTWSPNQ